ncbi:MAG: DUF7467 domain-containing protein [Planctomycetota bacterium]|jgi:hypothetical protein
MLASSNRIGTTTTLRLTAALLAGGAIVGAPRSAAAFGGEDTSDPPTIVCPADTTTVSDLVDGVADCMAPIPDFSGTFPGRVLIQSPEAGTTFLGSQLVTLIVNGETFCEVTAFIDGEDLDGNTIPDACEGLSCCETGDLRLLVMRYLGGSCDESDNLQGDKFECAQYTDAPLPDLAWIVANDKENDPFDGHVYFSGPVMLGADFPIDALAAGEDKLGAKTAIHLFSVMDLGDGEVAPDELLQQSVFKTDCSELLLSGDTFGASLLVDCRAADAPLPGDCCAFGKPRVLTMQFNGLDCSATRHGQDEDKVECFDIAPIPASARIIASDKEDPYDDDLPVQSVKFHTSCSQPLAIGDQFGASLLVGCVGEDEPVDEDDGDACQDGAKPAELTFTYEGTTCQEWDDATDGEGGNSQGKHTKCAQDDESELPMTAIVIATNKRAKDVCKNSAKIYFCGQVSLGEAFTVAAAAVGDSKLKGKLYLHVFDPADLPEGACPIDPEACAFEDVDPRQTVKLKSSCSKPLIPTEDFGAFRLESVVLEDGSSGDEDEGGAARFLQNGRR